MTYNKALSYSGLSLYKACPLLWHEHYVLGIREPSGAAADRGTRLHQLLEDFFNGAPYPSGDKDLRPWQDYMQKLKAAGNYTAEGEVAVDAQWQPVGFDAGDAYFRGKKDLDVVEGAILTLYDWKSGKIYPEHVDQGKAYACLTPGHEKYVARFVYLDLPLHVQEWEYSAAEVEDFRGEHTQIIEEIRHAEEFKPTPGSKCQWCKKSWRRGGDCKRAR